MSSEVQAVPADGKCVQQTPKTSPKIETPKKGDTASPQQINAQQQPHILELTEGKKKMFQKNRALCFSGSRARCRICGQTSSQKTRVIKAYCNKHKGGTGSFEKRIAPVCEKLREQLYETVMEIVEHDPLGFERPKGSWNSRGDWWWEMTKAFYMQCIRSISWQAIDLHEVIGKRIEVEYIDEIEFNTGPDYEEIGHCAFRITTKNDGQWVYDPTGVQFGPDWGMLVPWTEYKRKRIADRWMEALPLGTRFQEDSKEEYEEYFPEVSEALHKEVMKFAQRYLPVSEDGAQPKAEGKTKPKVKNGAEKEEVPKTESEEDQKGQEISEKASTEQVDSVQK